jgi:excisionase family DNA binding protein
MMEPLLTPVEVATFLRLDDSTVRRWCESGKLRSVKLPTRGFRIPKGEIERLLGKDSEDA